MAPEDVAANRQGLERAIRAASALLAAGGGAVEAAAAAVRSLEDNPVFNAGNGSAPNADGVAEMDASIMEGDQLNVGAVGALQEIANPVLVAKAMLGDQTVLRVGQGALRFALERGFTRTSVAVRRRGGSAHDTVGCLALDGRGTLAAATSTGGLEGAAAGRIGDSCLPGCGFYADSRAGAVSATGDGERIARMTLAARVVRDLEAAVHPQRAVELALSDLQHIGGDAGLIALDREGRIGWSFNATQFVVGWADSARPAPQVEVAGLETASSSSEPLQFEINN